MFILCTEEIQICVILLSSLHMTPDVSGSLSKNLRLSTVTIKQKVEWTQWIKC